MSSYHRSAGELRRLSATQAQSARALHQLVKDTRLVIEETERLLESPLWALMDIASPAPPPQARLDEA